MATCGRESQAREQRAERLHFVFVRRELDELDAARVGAGRKQGWRDARCETARDLVGEVAERAPAVRGNAGCGAGAESIVEDFQRERTLVAALEQRCHVVDERQLA